MPTDHSASINALTGQSETLSNFTRALHVSSICVRPETEYELSTIISKHTTKALPRGAGLSYGDCGLNQDQTIIDCRRMNHFIDFDRDSGILICQPGVTFADLFLIDADFIPPVIPGTLHATLGGGIANDIHGKNNPQAGTLGHHIQWIELQIGPREIRCSRQEHSDLFFATIGGLGLTGVIKRFAIKLTRASRHVNVNTYRFEQWSDLIDRLQQDHTSTDYQVAWLDLLNQGERCVLSQAHHCKKPPIANKKTRCYNIPKLPLCLINPFNMKLFNQAYFMSTTAPSVQTLAKNFVSTTFHPHFGHLLPVPGAKGKKTRLFAGHQTKTITTSLRQFNNPLDQVQNWNHLYGPKGFIQFQAVFDITHAAVTLSQLKHAIGQHRATPTLAVVKLFSQSGPGLLSFVQPGLSIAIDFIHNEQAVHAVRSMNQMMTELQGKVYLGKDLLLTPAQFQQQYANQVIFKQICQHYQCEFSSNLSRRIGLTT